MTTSSEESLIDLQNGSQRESTPDLVRLDTENFADVIVSNIKNIALWHYNNTTHSMDMIDRRFKCLRESYIDIDRYVNFVYQIGFQ